jgi:hypothetical protein
MESDANFTYHAPDSYVCQCVILKPTDNRLYVNKNLSFEKENYLYSSIKTKKKKPKGI